MSLVASFEEIVRNLRSEHRAAFHNHHTEQTTQAIYQSKSRFFAKVASSFLLIFNRISLCVRSYLLVFWCVNEWQSRGKSGGEEETREFDTVEGRRWRGRGSGALPACLPSCLPAFLPSLLLPEMFPIPSFHSIQVTVGIWQHSGIRNCHGIASLPIPPQLHQRGVWLIITSSNCTYCHEKLIMQHLTIKKRLTLSQA